MNHYVEIVKLENEEVVERMGPMSEPKAKKVKRGALINLNREDYYVHIVEEK